MWTVFENASDKHDRYTARKFIINDNGKPEPTDIVVTEPDLEALRTLFRKAGLARVPAPVYTAIEAWT